MDVRNCRKCKRLFNYVSGPITCQACREEEEKKFQEVRAYVVDHKGCGIPEVVEACDVTSVQIKQWMREERLEFSSDSGVGLSCESCGESIRSGKFCEKCKANMANMLQNTIRKPEPESAPKPKKTQDNPKMRFLDH